MFMNRFKGTELSISALGLGCMRLPKVTPEKDDIDYPRAQQIVDYAYEHGINYFDTAHMYHGGMSEEFVGHALKKYDRSSYFLASKMPVWMAETPADVERIFNLQLKRLQTDYFDFYLVHALNKNVFERCKELGAYEFLARKKQEGAIRFLGFSFHDVPDQLEIICNEYKWDFAQIQLNYLDWEMQNAKRQYEILERHGLPCIVMEPVRGGLLASPCEAANRIFKEARQEKSIASWAIRYAASLPNVLTVLSGMSNLEQIQDNIDTMEHFKPLTEQEHRIIDRAVAAYKTHNTIPCTACRYCMDCPNGVEIPKMFSLYNRYVIDRNAEGYRAAYAALPEAERAENCISCGVCAQHCPQAIPIPKELALIREAVAKL